MNMLICNKCFTPIYRGKRPYHITQCGHIACQSCLQQVEKQCPQCQQIGTISLPLNEPLTPTLAPFFQPLVEILETLLKAETFRSNQLKITLQRYHELDKKYDVLKTRYWFAHRNAKELMQKYVSLKIEKEKLDKKLLFSEMHRGTPRYVYRGNADVETPTDSGISTHQSTSISTGYSLGSSESLKSANITPIMRSANITPMGSVNVTPMGSVNSQKQYRMTADGFRVPINRKPPKSIGSLNMNCLKL